MAELRTCTCQAASLCPIANYPQLKSVLLHPTSCHESSEEFLQTSEIMS